MSRAGVAPVRDQLQSSYIMHPNDWAALITVAVSLAGAGPAASQTAQSSPAAERAVSLTRVVECRGIVEVQGRLACYDAAVAALDTAEREGDLVVVDRAQVSAARRQLFGFELPSLPAIFERGAAPDRIDSIETTLTHATLVGEGRWVFTLADGSAWRQIDVERVRFRNREGEDVRVRRAALGSYLLTVDGSRAVRVRRQ